MRYCEFFPLMIGLQLAHQPKLGQGPRPWHLLTIEHIHKTPKSWTCSFRDSSFPSRDNFGADRDFLLGINFSLFSPIQKSKVAFNKRDTLAELIPAPRVKATYKTEFMNTHNTYGT